MRNRILLPLLLSTATMVLGGNNGQPGMAFSISQNGINQIKNIIMPILFQSLQHRPLPDIFFDGGSLTNLRVDMKTPPSFDVVTITPDMETDDDDNLPNGYVILASPLAMVIDSN